MILTAACSCCKRQRTFEACRDLIGQVIYTSGWDLTPGSVLCNKCRTFIEHQKLSAYEYPRSHAPLGIALRGLA